MLLGGEAVPDAELMAESSVPAGVVAEALRYLVEGGPANLPSWPAFLSDTVLLTGDGFDEPRKMPEYGVPRRRAPRVRRPADRRRGLLPRPPAVSGNTAFVDTLCDAIEAAGANALPVYCGSLRGADAGAVRAARPADALVATVLAAGGTQPREASAGGDDEAWDTGALADARRPGHPGAVPDLVAGRLGRRRTPASPPWTRRCRSRSPSSTAGSSPCRSPSRSTGPDDVPVYVADPERAARVAGIAVRHARLRHKPNAEKKLALVFTAYPTKHSRVGNAVGLDTPASAVRLLRRAAGRRLRRRAATPDDGDELIHRADRRRRPRPGVADRGAAGRGARARAARRLPGVVRQAARGAARRDVEHWGEPPGCSRTSTATTSCSPACIRERRSSSSSRRAASARTRSRSTTTPTCRRRTTTWPPTAGWRQTASAPTRSSTWASTARWSGCPARALGLSAGCAPDAVLGDLPLFYPFIVNDPGEGTQAKRRGHATVVDHLVPPMARADTYDDLAKLEQLLDEYALV